MIPSLHNVSRKKKHGEDAGDELLYVLLWIPRIRLLKVRASLLRLFFIQCSLPSGLAQESKPAESEQVRLTQPQHR